MALLARGPTLEQRLAVRRERSRPLIAELEIWMRQQRALLPTKNDTAKAINYLLSRWTVFTRFLDDGRVYLTNNAAERALRGVAIGRRNWIFAGSDAGGHRFAAVYTLIETCKMNDVDPQAWLTVALARLPDHPANKAANLLPWNWKANQRSNAFAARALRGRLSRLPGVLAGCVPTKGPNDISFYRLATNLS